jgi:hypothetical protein
VSSRARPCGNIMRRYHLGNSRDDVTAADLPPTQLTPDTSDVIGVIPFPSLRCYAV